MSGRCHGPYTVKYRIAATDRPRASYAWRRCSTAAFDAPYGDRGASGPSSSAPPSNADPVPLLNAISTMAASAVIGFAVLIAPSGLGVREALIVTLLAPSLGVGGAGLVAIACRIVMIVVELSLSLWGIAPWLSAAREAVEAVEAAEDE